MTLQLTSDARGGGRACLLPKQALEASGAAALQSHRRAALVPPRARRGAPTRPACMGRPFELPTVAEPVTHPEKHGRTGREWHPAPYSTGPSGKIASSGFSMADRMFSATLDVSFWPQNGSFTS